MLCRVTQDGQVLEESSDKMWSTGEGNGKPLQYACLENPMNIMKWQKDRTLKEPQDEAGLTKTFQTWPRGWFHIP